MSPETTLNQSHPISLDEQKLLSSLARRLWVIGLGLILVSLSIGFISYQEYKTVDETQVNKIKENGPDSRSGLILIAFLLFSSAIPIINAARKASNASRSKSNDVRQAIYELLSHINSSLKTLSFLMIIVIIWSIFYLGFAIWFLRN